MNRGFINFKFVFLEGRRDGLVYARLFLLYEVRFNLGGGIMLFFWLFICFICFECILVYYIIGKDY